MENNSTLQENNPLENVITEFQEVITEGNPEKLSVFLDQLDSTLDMKIINSIDDGK